VQGNVDDPVDLAGRRHGAERGHVPLGSPGLPGLARVRLPSAERVGLAMLLASGFVEALPEFAVL
jgi:hypothetical protein